MFDFIGHYWWLAFPLFGVLAAVGRAWERGARMRHKRRLEVMHAKAELKAARRGETGAIPIADRVTPAVAATTATATTPTQLERLFAAHDAVTARWLEYELDVAKIIAFPAMSDGRQPLTAAFLRAKRVADGARPASATARISKDQLAEYRDAVTDFEVAFDVAERDARRLRDSSFTQGERKRLDTAKQLLGIAIDQAATPAERQVAYRRVREELDGLILLSDEAIEVLESKVALELTTGTVSTSSTDAQTRGMDAAAPPAAQVPVSPPSAAAPTAGAPEALPEPLPAPVAQPAPAPRPAHRSAVAGARARCRDGTRPNRAPQTALEATRGA